VAGAAGAELAPSVGLIAVLPVSALPATFGCSAAVVGAVADVVVATAVGSTKPVADGAGCGAKGATKPVVVFPFVASGAAPIDTSIAVAGSVGPLSEVAGVPFAGACPPIAVAAAPIATDPAEPPPFVGGEGGVIAAAVDELAAIAAAAIASGAVELAVTAGVAFATGG